MQSSDIESSLLAATHGLPKAHSQFRRQSHEVVSSVLKLRGFQLGIKDFLRLHLLNEGVVLVDSPTFAEFQTTLLIKSLKATAASNPTKAEVRWYRVGP